MAETAVDVVTDERPEVVPWTATDGDWRGRSTILTTIDFDLSAEAEPSLWAPQESVVWR
jgi:hypothetical protein